MLTSHGNAALQPFALVNLNPAEGYVLTKFKKSQVADLKEQFGSAAAKRTLRAEFLEALLAGQKEEIRQSNQRLWIRNAIVAGPMELVAVTVAYDVKLEECQFMGEVDFSYTKFARNLKMMNCRFQQKAIFSKIEIQGDADFSHSRFDRELKFNWAAIGKGLFIEGIEAKGEADFSGSVIGQHLFGRSAIFWSRTDFRSVKVDYLAFFDQSFFHGEARFRNLQVGSSIYLTDAVFGNNTTFEGSDIKRDFLAKGVRFVHEEEYATFFGLKVGRLLVLKNAIFLGPVDFSAADIGMNFEANNARFFYDGKTDDNDKGLYFSGMRIGDTASFEGVHFWGKVNFSGSDIKGRFTTSHSRYKSDCEAFFSGIHVGQLAEFYNASFYGPLKLDGAEIGGRLVADADQGTILSVRVFHGPVSLKEAHFSHLRIGEENPKGNDGLEPKPLHLPKLDLESTEVKESCIIRNTDITDLKAWNFHVKGQSIFENVKIEKQADLRDSNFFNLKLIKVAWPQVQTEPDKDNILLGGMTLTSISTQDVPGAATDWEPIFEWVKKSKYEPRVYMQLKDFFERSGHEKQANRIFVEMKDREKWFNSWWDYVLSPFLYPLWLIWKFLGYGRHPFRIFYFALPVIMFGALILNDRHLKRTSLPYERKWKRTINRWIMKLLLSLELFTPGVDLGLEKRWEPPEFSRRLLLAIYFLRFSGWILIPIFLAAIYTKFK